MEPVTIAVLEDDLLIGSLIRFKLSRMGFDVESFLNGTEALEFYLSNPLPKLIITDIMMPKMGGIEFARNFRRLNQNIPIVAMTAGTLEYGVESESLFSFWVQKNGSIDDLLELILKRVSQKVSV